MRDPRNLGTGLYLFVLLLFLTPWLSVECAGITVDVTGVDMALGNDTEIAGQTSEGDVELFALAALLFAVAGAGLFFFMRERAGAVARALVGVLGGLSMIALKLKVDGDIDSGFGGGDLASVGGLINVSWEIGFWLTVLGFFAAAAVQALADDQLRSAVGLGGPEGSTDGADGADSAAAISEQPESPQ
ncbi:MAG: hypothetical protein V3S31_05015 [Dehalococcoidia bacterium]